MRSRALWSLVTLLLVSTSQTAAAQNRRPAKGPAKTTRPPAGDSTSRTKAPDAGEPRQGSASEKKSQPTPTAAPKHHFLGIGAEIGYESTFGNGAVLHLYPVSFLELAAGVGYNSTGLKAGGGPGLLLWLTPSVGLLAGGAFVYSQGTSGTVSLDANFIPEGSTSSEKIKASKKYKVSAAQMLGFWGGVTFHLMDSLRLDIKGGYNKVISGNQVSYDDKIEYSKSISPTNEDAFNKQFNDQAESLVQAGGPGITIGLQFLL